MNYYSIRDLKNTTKTVCENVHSYGQAVITNNGKPSMLMLDISENDYEITLQAIKQAKAMIAFNSMRLKAAENGFMSEEEIDSEIAAYRKERKERRKNAHSN